MITYNDLYEILRKEKYAEALQTLPKSFINDLVEYLNDKRDQSVQEDNLFMDSVAKSKKQLENSIALFKELIRLRKKKLLNLVFVAAETGILKRDYENMLSFEKEIFDKLVKAFEEGDKELNKLMSGKNNELDKNRNKLVLFNNNIDQFVDMSGNLIGPFKSGELANLDSKVSEILVSDGKASFVDEDS